MLLTSGTRLGPYEVVAPLGAGGMGEVYRARDTRLGRDVAVKVLPRHLSTNPEIRARFEREARTVSGLNHPHICTLHDVGRDGDTDYLVMELVEGETLADRLRKGPLPLDEVLRLGAQVAEALDRAHRAGVVHRDLKPGNVMLTKSGAKLMDFGLARPTGMAGPATGSGATVLALTQSPTVAQPLTAEGTIVGTFQYMAPEQLEGREADARADIWALGCVLYEMATGRRAFEGGSQASLISAIMKDQPRPMAEVAPLAPPALERLVRECLAKDPERRIQSAHDVRAWLETIREVGTPSGLAAAVAVRRGRRERVLWIGVLAVTVGVAAVAAFALRGAGPPPAPLRASLMPPRGIEYASSVTRPIPLAVSPDGRHIVFCASRDGGPIQLWVRALGDAVPRALEGTEDAVLPFFSADGRSIGFFADRKLKRVDVAGGPVISLADVGDPRGGTWSRHDEILYAPQSNGPLWAVSANGGRPVQVTVLDSTVREDTHRYPHWLPDGKHFLYLARRSGAGSGEEPTIYAAGRGSSGRKAVLGVASNVIYASGHLLYARAGILMAQPFDPGRLATTGPAAALIEDLQWDERFSRGVFSASSNGVLAFLTGQARTLSQLEWRDRSGARLGRVGEPAEYTYGGSPMLSPDGTRAVMCIINPSRGSSDAWVVNLATGRRSRVTVDDRDHPGAAWTHDGRRIVLLSGGELTEPKPFSLAVRSPESTTGDTLLRDADWIWPLGASPDGRYIMVRDDEESRQGDLYAVALSPPHAIVPVAMGPGSEQHGQFSPDGRYVAYTSFESGRPEIYVVTFPEPTGRWQVTQNGGIEPRWNANGRELFYVDLRNGLNAVEVATGPSGFEAGAVRSLFPASEGRGDWRYDVSPDGSRFLMMAPAEGETTAPISLLLNWSETLRK